MKRIVSDIDCLLRRLAVALAVVVIGGSLTLVGSAVAAPGDKEEKEVKQEKVEKIEKIEKELKEQKEDSRARNDRDRVILNLNKGNLIRLLDIDDLLIEEPD